MKAQSNPNSFINYDNENSPVVSGILEEQSFLRRYQYYKSQKPYVVEPNEKIEKIEEESK